MPGCGKTTIAYIVAKKLDISIEEINASDERGIDVIREKVKNYSKMSKDLIILLDECDNLTFDSQQALRRILELSKNKFILSANKENKIIPPIKSRCALFHFDGLQDKDVLLKLAQICKYENIKIEEKEKEALIRLAKRSHGDMRYAINLLDGIISEDKELNIESVLEKEPIEFYSNILTTAIDGDWIEAKRLLEDEFIKKRSMDEIWDALYKALDGYEDKSLVIPLYEKIAELEYRCRVGANPLLQLVSFITYAYILKHVKK